MKLNSSIAVAAAAQLASASTSASQVYTYDPQWQPATSGALSPLEARLVLAQRAGVEDYHEADLLKDGVLEAMNVYGERRPLFDSAEAKAKRAFVLLEAEYDAGGMSMQH